MKLFCSAKKKYVCKQPLHGVGMRVKFKNKYLQIAWKVLVSIMNQHFPPPCRWGLRLGVVVNSKYWFARIFMKCPDYHRKVILKTVAIWIQLPSTHRFSMCADSCITLTWSNHHSAEAVLKSSNLIHTHKQLSLLSSVHSFHFTTTLSVIYYTINL